MDSNPIEDGMAPLKWFMLRIICTDEQKEKQIDEQNVFWVSELLCFIDIILTKTFGITDRSRNVSSKSIGKQMQCFCEEDGTAQVQNIVLIKKFKQ